MVSDCSFFFGGCHTKNLPWNQSRFVTHFASSPGFRPKLFQAGPPKPSRHRVASLYSCSHQLRPPGERFTPFTVSPPKIHSNLVMLDPSMASGFLWPYSRISSYSSRANLFLAAMLGSHGINGHQGYQQDFSTPAWDHILKTPHLMKQNNNIDQYWCCCFICFHSEVDQAAIIDPGSPSPSICWSTEIPGVKRVALHLRQTLGTPTSTLHTFIMIFRISMFT